MELSLIKDYALNKMEQYNLINEGWKFDFDRAKKRLGYCCYTTKIISLSYYHVINNPEKHVFNTVLHELAHALVKDIQRGHGIVWKNKAIEVGAEPKACNDSEELVIIPGRYQATCGICGNVFHFHRRPSNRSYWCMKCGRTELSTLKWIDMRNNMFLYS